MSRLIDKLVLLIICVTSCMLKGDGYAPVIIMLTGVGASSMVQYFSGKRAALVIIGACSAVCGIYPEMFCIMPLMVYDALCEKKWQVSLFGLAVLLHADRLDTVQMILCVFGILAAALIYRRVSALESMVGSLTSLRDTVEEQNLQLGEKNNMLLDAQDAQIHLATLKERNRIAREIHDNVGHMLTRSILQAGAISVLNKDEDLKGPIGELKATLDSAMTSIRQSVHGLHDESIDLKAAINECIKTVGERFTVSLDYDMEDDVPARVRLCFIGIIKEGLSNAAKHSNGDRIDITVREHPGFYQLSVSDNGSCGEIKDSGIGLSSMKERAESIGGMISFTPSPEGFRIFMTVKK